MSSKVSGRTQPVQPPENPDRGSSRQRRQRQERRESSRSKIEQQRRSHHEQEPEGNTAEIIENLEPCMSDFHDKSDYSKSYYIFDSNSNCCRPSYNFDSKSSCKGLFNSKSLGQTVIKLFKIMALTSSKVSKTT